MTKETFKDELIYSLNRIDTEDMGNEIDTINSLLMSYDKASSILEYCDDSEDLSSFTLFQESAVVMESADEDGDDGDDGDPGVMINGKMRYKNKGFRRIVDGKLENIIMSILRIIPRLVTSLCNFISKKLNGSHHFNDIKSKVSGVSSNVRKKANEAWNYTYTHAVAAGKAIGENAERIGNAAIEKLNALKTKFVAKIDKLWKSIKNLVKKLKKNDVSSSPVEEEVKVIVEHPERCKKSELMEINIEKDSVKTMIDLDELKRMVSDYRKHFEKVKDVAVQIKNKSIENSKDIYHILTTWSINDYKEFGKKKYVIVKSKVEESIPKVKEKLNDIHDDLKDFANEMRKYEPIIKESCDRAIKFMNKFTKETASKVGDVAVGVGRYVGEKSASAGKKAANALKAWYNKLTKVQSTIPDITDTVVAMEDTVDTVDEIVNTVVNNIDDMVKVTELGGAEKEVSTETLDSE